MKENVLITTAPCEGKHLQKNAATRVQYLSAVWATLTALLATWGHQRLIKNLDMWVKLKSVLEVDWIGS